MADRVILLEDYVLSDATPRSREVTKKSPPAPRSRKEGCCPT